MCHGGKGRGAGRIDEVEGGWTAQVKSEVKFPVVEFHWVWEGDNNDIVGRQGEKTDEGSPVHELRVE